MLHAALKGHQLAGFHEDGVIAVSKVGLIVVFQKDKTNRRIVSHDLLDTSFGVGATVAMRFGGADYRRKIQLGVLGVVTLMLVLLVLTVNKGLDITVNFQAMIVFRETK
jgi:hypothetical protein